MKLPTVKLLLLLLVGSMNFFSCITNASQLTKLPITIQIKNYGIYTLLKTTTNSFKPESTAGYASVINASLLLETEQIPIKKGQLFGFQYKIQDLNNDKEWVPVSIRIKHPSTHDYLGYRTSGFTEQSYARLKADGSYHNGAFYVLNEPYEMVAGEWVISVVYQQHTLVSKTFHLVDVSQ